MKLRGTGPRIYLQEGSMSYSPILVVHICGGTLGLLSGTAAMSFRKGSPRHVLAGEVFVASMLLQAAVAGWRGIVGHNPNKTRSAAVTFYLILKTWLAARSSA